MRLNTEIQAVDQFFKVVRAFLRFAKQFQRCFQEFLISNLQDANRENRNMLRERLNRSLTNGNGPPTNEEIYTRDERGPLVRAQEVPVVTF